jgi:hypothetical protein
MYRLYVTLANNSIDYMLQNKNEHLIGFTSLRKCKYHPLPVPSILNFSKRSSRARGIYTTVHVKEKQKRNIEVGVSRLWS